MSDFFGDDFTAELKAYFLTALIAETEKFIDLVDDKLWKRIANEVAEQAKAWSVDAKTNEFMYMAAWFDGVEKRSGEMQSKDDLLKTLEALKAYATTLLKDKNDTAELATQFTMLAQSTHEVLLLHCKSGNQEFAIPLLNVVEISGSLPLYALPERKAGIMGVVPYRGEAVPVVNLQDHGFMKLDSQNTFYVVCEHAGKRFSLQVTATEDLLTLKGGDLQSVDAQSSIIKVSFVKQFFIKNNRSVMVLDLEQLVAS